MQRLPGGKQGGGQTEEDSNKESQAEDCQIKSLYAESLSERQSGGGGLIEVEL